jgi:hypothetical protein
MSDPQIRRAIGLLAFGFKGNRIAEEYGVTSEVLRKNIANYHRRVWRKRVSETRKKAAMKRLRAARDSAIRKALARGLTVREAAKVFQAGQNHVVRIKNQMEAH